MAMMKVRHVRMVVHELNVAMPVTVRFAEWVLWAVSMLVVLVVAVNMVVFQLVVLMVVRVALA